MGGFKAKGLRRLAICCAAMLAAGCTGYTPGTFATKDEQVVTNPGVFSGPDGVFSLVGGPQTTSTTPAAGAAAAAGVTGATVAAGVAATEVAAGPAADAEFATVGAETERVILADGTVVERRIIVQERPVTTQ